MMKEKFERWIEDCPCDYNFLQYGEKLKNSSDLLSGFVEDETVRIYQFYPIERKDEDKNEGGVL
ncbi:MAG: hypothetical protein GOVbin4691_16 [Prokaryotic dsDNA virus sp.]|nr:MAG: hypothetical protein GOVbin4691_16 [Prokaryotic dsDNA virus sp.]